MKQRKDFNILTADSVDDDVRQTEHHNFATTRNSPPTTRFRELLQPINGLKDLIAQLERADWIYLVYANEFAPQFSAKPSTRHEHHASSFLPRA
jgi:hypothetical protein